ncbi:MAG: hypothetical protein H7Y07_02200 [Pyrinomonadaceae bacterium]|nr:hypothetical protein [Sphingobacteriaceae bacterium]
MKLKNCLLLVFILIHFNCNISPNASMSQGVHSTLKQSGKNKKELFKVINHFKNNGNPLELKAAYFLIENMLDRYHYRGPTVVRYRNSFNRMDSLIKSGNGIFDRSWDSIQKNYPPPDLQTAEIVNDAKVIKADFLIKHIELAFKAWQFPWAKNLSFEEFCEYILPYKLLNEEPEMWMEDNQVQYQWLPDSLKNLSNTKKAVLLINNELKKWFYINARFECNWDINYSDLKKMRTGKCAHATQLAAYSMRAMGIPVVMDYTPHWANKNFNHQWNALLYQNKTLHFIGTESDPGKDKIVFTREYWIRRKRGKIFRHTYSVQKNSLANQVSSLDDIPDEFHSKNIKDVTKDYVPVSTVNIRLKGQVDNATYAYLCVFSDQEWKPIYWTKIGYFHQATFEDMEKGIVYLPAYFKSNKIIPAGKPFLLTDKGKLEEITPNNTNIKVALFSKYGEGKGNDIVPQETYELFFWNNDWESLGQKTADADSLIYQNVPKGSLLMLKNIKSGAQERIFTYTTKQIWW